MLYDYIPQLRLQSSVLANPSTRDIAWGDLTQTFQRLTLPYLNLERLLAPARLIELSTGGPTRLIQHVVRFFEGNHALVELLNS